MISFIIPAHNEERLLGSTLVAVHNAAREVAEPYEVIVVDDGSSDGTVEAALRHGARVIAVNHRQIARARNAGARAASGDVLIFVDADTIVSAGAVRGAVMALRGGAAGGGALVTFTGPLPRWAHAVAWLLSVSMRLGRMAAGCYVFCSREAFDRVDGFDERLFVAEELALSRALRREGPVIILRTRVQTSGRKLRTYTLVEQLRLMASLAVGGRRMLRRRERLDYWYGPRRNEPE
jgi:glycosyltransferase involved in cell wall biosynthesis